MTLMHKLTPLLWGLFSAGGTVAALLFPAHMFLTVAAYPYGWLRPPSYGYLIHALHSPWVRVYFLGFISLPLFHWAHRFRYTLYDGLQIKHLTLLIVTVCYGSAIAGSAFAAYVLWSLP